MTHKYRFVGIKLCKPTEKYNITILHEEEEQAILRCFEVTLCIAVTQSDHFGNRKTLRALKINYLQGFVVPGAGIEPARIAPLVFETSASTDSAIRAGCCFICSVSGLWVRRSGFDW